MQPNINSRLACRERRAKANAQATAILGVCALVVGVIVLYVLLALI